SGGLREASERKSSGTNDYDSEKSETSASLAPERIPAMSPRARTPTPARRRRTTATKSAAKSAARKSAATRTGAKRAAKKKYVCPDCGATFDRPQSLGAHRRQAHGVVGNSKRSQSRARSARQAAPARAGGRRVRTR